jgi:hypothetical protein
MAWAAGDSNADRCRMLVLKASRGEINSSGVASCLFVVAAMIGNENGGPAIRHLVDVGLSE